MKYFLSFLFFFISLCSEGQTTFQKVFRGNSDSYFFSVLQTSDNGYLLGGVTKNYGLGEEDIHLIKTDRFGDTLWTKTYGTLTQDFLFSLDQTPDGGFIICGTISGFASLIKIDFYGSIEWTKTFFYGAFAAHPCNGGGYILFGTGFNGLTLMKTDSIGNFIWAKTYGPGISINSPNGSYFKQTMDNGFVFTGSVQGIGAGGTDAILVKTDDIGNLEWSKLYGGISGDQGESVLQLSDGGFLMSGISQSFGIFGNYVIRTTAIGDTIWTRCYETASGVWLEQTNVNSEFIITGGNGSLCLLKININGDTLWTTSYKPSNGDKGYCIRQTQDGGYIVAGTTRIFGHSDGYLIKIDGSGFSVCNQYWPSYNVLRTQTQVTNPQLSTSSVTNSIINSSLTMSRGAMDTSLCFFDFISKNILSTDIIISPNPFDNTATIQVSNAGIETADMNIYNTMGSLVRSEKIPNITSYILYRGDLSNGMYFYELRTSDYSMIGSGKFVIE